MPVFREFLQMLSGKAARPCASADESDNAAQKTFGYLINNRFSCL